MIHGERWLDEPLSVNQTLTAPKHNLALRSSIFIDVEFTVTAHEVDYV